ncbi:hypothetical protein L9F63_021789, partial [Diploptera punctata]
SKSRGAVGIKSMVKLLTKLLMACKVTWALKALQFCPSDNLPSFSILSYKYKGI